MVIFKTPYIFVYGTLKRRFHIKSSHTFKKISTFHATGKTKGMLYNTGSYPAFSNINSRYKIKGEIFRLNSIDKALRFLDKYEHAYYGEKEYHREIIPVIDEYGFRIFCNVYVYNKSTISLTYIRKGEYCPKKKKKYSL